MQSLCNAQSAKNFPQQLCCQSTTDSRRIVNMSTMVDQPREDNTLEVRDRSLKRGHEEVVTPTTPRPLATQMFQSLDAEARPPGSLTDTPAVSSTMSGGQQSLPAAAFAFPAQHEGQRALLYRASSQTSVPSSLAVDDIDMDGSEDDQDDSDNDTENGEPGRSSKKKKGQRFFCTEFPPCSLSFTRSEHLARHIRYIQCSLP